MSQPRKTPDFEKLAALYEVCPRTVRRWHDAGCNVNCLESVATHLLGLKGQKPETLEVVISELENELQSIF